jgi:hypothetical protein
MKTKPLMMLSCRVLLLLLRLLLLLLPDLP